MYFENNRTLAITPEWNAEFVFRYEVGMGIDGWGLILHGPDGKKIEKFKNFISYCKDPIKDTDEELKKCLILSDCRRQLTIRTPYEGDWMVDLATGNHRKLPPTEEEIRQAVDFEEAYRRSRGSAWDDESHDLPNSGSESVNRPNKRSCGCGALILVVGISLLAKFLWIILHSK